jgi:hypothetical protein
MDLDNQGWEIVKSYQDQAKPEHLISNEFM